MNSKTLRQNVNKKVDSGYLRQLAEHKRKRVEATIDKVDELQSVIQKADVSERDYKQALIDLKEADAVIEKLRRDIIAVKEELGRARTTSSGTPDKQTAQSVHVVNQSLPSKRRYRRKAPYMESINRSAFDDEDPSNASKLPVFETH